jgi:alginate O-acetyltransferase complex protein AlgI
MVFNSLTFVVFFACVLGLHSLPLPWTIKKINLLVASYLFYAAWNPPFVILLWVSTVVDWYAAQGLVKARREATRHAWMLLSVIANLGMLGYFKYGQFLLDNFTTLMSALGIVYHPAHYDIVLPVGISFYTFATMSYTLDVYLRRAAPARNLLDYALFVTFFPHLVAGPIMRPTELVPQFAQPRRATGEQLRFGLALMTLGLFNKIVLADSFLSSVAERVYDSDKIPGALDAWVATLAFSGQIFCDFAGYSTTAIGAALCLGFAMPDTFRFPYAAVGFSDFWRRWHITLSSWLRDYLYIPLGGNRHGARRTYIALMGTMLLGGLWHGAIATGMRARPRPTARASRNRCPCGRCRSSPGERSCSAS